MRAERELVALGGALAQVPSGRVEDLRGIPGEGERGLQRLHGVVGVAVVAHRDAGAHES